MLCIELPAISNIFLLNKISFAVRTLETYTIITFCIIMYDCRKYFTLIKTFRLFFIFDTVGLIVMRLEIVVNKCYNLSYRATYSI